MMHILNKTINVLKTFFDTFYNHCVWFVRDVKYGMLTHNRDDLENRLLVGGHIIEKGITMPNRRYGFGLGVVQLVESMCNKYMDKYGTDNEQLQFAIDDLREYLQIHKTSGHDLPKEVVSGLEHTINRGGRMASVKLIARN